MQGPNVSRQTIDSLMSLTEKGDAPKVVQPGKDRDDEYVAVNPALAAFLCGGCLAACPTGAIYEKFAEGT